MLGTVAAETTAAIRSAATIIAKVTPGDRKDCPKCREAFEAEMYVWYGTNE
jgi:hypothetical protein